MVEGLPTLSPAGSNALHVRDDTNAELPPNGGGFSRPIAGSQGCRPSVAGAEIINVGGAMIYVNVGDVARSCPPAWDLRPVSDKMTRHPRFPSPDTT